MCSSKLELKPGATFSTAVGSVTVVEKPRQPVALECAISADVGPFCPLNFMQEFHGQVVPSDMHGCQAYNLIAKGRTAEVEGGGSATVEDIVKGFAYFQQRNLSGKNAHCQAGLAVCTVFEFTPKT